MNGAKKVRNCWKNNVLSKNNNIIRYDNKSSILYDIHKVQGQINLLKGIYWPPLFMVVSLFPHAPSNQAVV